MKVEDSQLDTGLRDDSPGSEKGTVLQLGSPLRNQVQAQAIEFIVDHVAKMFPGYEKNDYVFFVVGAFSPDFAQWFETLASLSSMNEEFFKFCFDGNPARVLSQIFPSKQVAKVLEEMGQKFGHRRSEFQLSSVPYISGSGGPVQVVGEVTQATADVFGEGIIPESDIDRAIAVVTKGETIYPPTTPEHKGVESRPPLTYDVLRQVHMALRPKTPQK